MSVEMEEWPKCLYVRTADCRTDQTKLTSIHCIICLSTNSHHQLVEMLKISSNFIIGNASLGYIDKYIGTGNLTKQSLRGLADLLKQNYPKEWEELTEANKKMMMVLETEPPGGENQ